MSAESTLPRILPVDEAIRARRSERSFSSRELGADLLRAILEDARLAPSGYNLQPTRFVVVRGEARAALARAAFDQRQVAEAPVTVCVVADTRPDLTAKERIVGEDLAAGAIDPAYASFLGRIIPLMFRRGPAGILGLVKGVGTHLLSPFRPLPSFPAFRPREWALRQAMLAAGYLLLAAAARGVSSCPMEGFDEARVRRLLGLPRRFIVALLVPLGFGTDGGPRRMRLPLEELVFDQTWGARLTLPSRDRE